MATDTIRQLEERLARLEEELRKVKTELGKGKEPEQPWWKQIAGSAKDSKVFAEIVRLGRQIRRADRPRTKDDDTNSTGGKRRKARAATRKR